MPIRGANLPHIPYGAHVIILFVLSFAIFIMNVLITFSSPFIVSINFLSIRPGDDTTTFGSFGWCGPGFCLPNQVGYESEPQVNRALTGAMVLWAVSLIFLFFLILSIMPLLFVHESRALRFVGNRAFFLFAADLSAVIVVLAWLFSIFGWSIAHRQFEVSGLEPTLGPAIWMGLASAICATMWVPLFLAFHLLHQIVLMQWPKDAWDGTNTLANGGVGRGVPANVGNGYYHYKRTTREVVPRY